MNQWNHRQTYHRGSRFSPGYDHYSTVADSSHQPTARKNHEALQALKAAEIVFSVTLRFLLRVETVQYLKNLFGGCSEGDVSVNGYRVRYLLADDVANMTPEGTLTLQVLFWADLSIIATMTNYKKRLLANVKISDVLVTGHLNSCLILLESWDHDYIISDQFWNEYYGGRTSLCVKTRHLLHERTVGMLIGTRGQQVDSLSHQHDCNIQILGLTLPKSNERVACIVGRIPDTVRVIRDMFLTLLASSNGLNGHAIFYHPCNYVFEVSKLSGGIYESQAMEQQRLITSRGPQHRRGSQLKNRLPQGSRSNVTKPHTQQVPQCYPNIEDCHSDFVRFSEENRRQNVFSLVSGPDRSPRLPNDLTTLHQYQLFYMSSIKRNLRFQQTLYHKMGPLLMNIPGPAFRHSPFLLCLSGSRTNFPPANETFINPELKTVSTSQISSMCPPHAMVPSQIIPAIVAGGPEEFSLPTDSILIAKETLFQLHLECSRDSFLISESSWSRHKSLLGNFGITPHPFLTLTCFVESMEPNPIKSHDVLRCVGDLKEWYIERAKVDEISAIGCTLDMVAQVGDLTSANVWFALANTLQPKSQTAQYDRKSNKPKLFRTPSSMVNQIDRSSPPRSVVSLNVNNVNETSPKSVSSKSAKKLMQREKFSAFQISSLSQTIHKRVPNVRKFSVAVGSQLPSYYGQRCHLHALAQRVYYRTESGENQRRYTFSYLGCTETFFSLTSSHEKQGSVTVAELLVDHFTAGSIIGTGGESINLIRQTCQCVIFIQPQTWQGGHRRIIFSGSRKAVEAALALIAGDLRSRASLAEYENFKRQVYIEFIEHTAIFPPSGEDIPVVDPIQIEMKSQKFSDESGIQSVDSARNQEDGEDGEWIKVIRKSSNPRSATIKKVPEKVTPENVCVMDLAVDPLKCGHSVSQFDVCESSFCFRDTSVNFLANDFADNRCRTGRVALLTGSPVGTVTQQAVS